MSLRISLVLLMSLTFLTPLLTSAQSRKPRAVKLKCSPQKLFKGDTLTLEMATPHSGDLAVRAPDGTDFLVVFQPNNEGPDAQPLMKAAEFMKLGQLRLVTDQIKARPWEYGRDRNELIFTRTGWY